jgi:pyruvate kinase
MLEEDTDVVFAPESEAREGEVPVTYERLAEDVQPGTTILLDDGLLAVEVTRVSGRRAVGKVRHGGLLKPNKGMNLPGAQLSVPAVTDTDRATIEVAVEHGADFIGISFVRRAEDVRSVRALVPPEVHLVSKIEKSAAIEDLARILHDTDALMVARGDLGVELPFEEVPLIQKRLIGHANRTARPVITATQMLESMVAHARPTRAEASDVANAILDGTDAVMLSAETAVGRYPVAAVKAMARIIRQVEAATAGEQSRRRRTDWGLRAHPFSVDDAIASATSLAAQLLDVPLIVCLTHSGFTARKIAANRPPVPIVGLSTEPTTCRYLSLVWGVIPMLAGEAPTYDAMLGAARQLLTEHAMVRTGDRIVVTAGVPFHVPGTTNLLKVETI